MSRSAVICLVLAVAVSACGDASSTEDDDPDCPIANPAGCAQAHGVYRTTYSERSGGTCGSRESITSRAAEERVTRFTGSCPADIMWSSDFCMASFEVDCTEEERGLGFTNHQDVRTTYARDGMSRTGVFDFSVFDANGNLTCQSTYDTLSVNTSCDKQM